MRICKSILYLILTVLLLSSCVEKQLVDIKNLGDFTIVNVFSEDKLIETQRNYPKINITDYVSKDNYAYYSYLSLRPNRTYTFLLGNQYMFGNYEFKSDELVLNPSTGESIHLRILDATANSVQLHGDFKDFKSDFLVVVDSKSSFYLNLRPEISVDEVAYDYRLKELNQWRIKPNAPETDAEIKTRLINNLNYIASYMYANQMAQKEIINVRGIRSPFLHAANGVFLYEWKEVDNYWKLIFYDEKDAKKAYKMLKLNFDRHYDIPKTSDWLYLNEYLIRELIKNVESSIIIDDNIEKDA
nr:hypothetical protein [uncultured Flavobacterium sp.]